MLRARRREGRDDKFSVQVSGSQYLSVSVYFDSKSLLCVAVAVKIVSDDFSVEMCSAERSESRA